MNQMKKPCQTLDSTLPKRDLTGPLSKVTIIEGLCGLFLEMGMRIDYIIGCICPVYSESPIRGAPVYP